MRAPTSLAWLLVAPLTACAADVTVPVAPVVDEDVLPPAAERTLADVPTADAALLLQVVLPPLAGRVVTEEERALLEAEGAPALTAILSEVVAEPAFADSARSLIEQKLAVNGQRDGIDFDLPGNLAAHIAKHELPWSTILTADSCFDAQDNAIECDTGAPYAAGVIATRGYMISRASRFNLTRSSTLMRAFACVGYPQPETLQPLLPKEKLIPLFRAESLEEATETDPRAAGGFGNGTGCYYCHGQFGAHAQLFVKFDTDGIYHPEATGEQADPGELGRSYNGLMTSHFVDPEDAKLEESMMFGQPVQNLPDAMRVFTENPAFSLCAVRNVMEQMLLVDPSIDVDFRLLERIAIAAGEDPSLQKIVVATLTDPLVIDSVAASLRGEP